MAGNLIDYGLRPIIHNFKFVPIPLCRLAKGIYWHVRTVLKKTSELADDTVGEVLAFEVNYAEPPHVFYGLVDEIEHRHWLLNDLIMRQIQICVAEAQDKYYRWIRHMEIITAGSVLLPFPIDVSHRLMEVAAVRYVKNGYLDANLHLLDSVNWFPMMHVPYLEVVAFRDLFNLESGSEQLDRVNQNPARISPHLQRSSPMQRQDTNHSIGSDEQKEWGSVRDGLTSKEQGAQIVHDNAGVGGSQTYNETDQPRKKQRTIAVNTTQDEWQEGEPTLRNRENQSVLSLQSREDRERFRDGVADADLGDGGTNTNAKKDVRADVFMGSPKHPSTSPLRSYVNSSPKGKKRAWDPL